MTVPGDARRARPEHRTCAWIVTIAILIMSVRIGLTWGVFSDTIDEPYHLGAGVSWFQARGHTLGIQHPPLARIVAATPLVVAGVRSDDPLISAIVDDLHAFEVGHDVLLRGKFSYWTKLTAARAAMLVFPVLAVVYAYLLGRYVGGRWAGCAAAVFFSTDPTLLGHGTWIATDVPAAAGYLASIYHGLRLVARPTPRRGVVAGFALGLAVACKFTCLLALPALGIIWLLRGRRALATLPRIAPFGVVALLVAFCTLWATYLFDVGRVDDLPVKDPAAIADLPQWLRRAPVPMPTAVAGLAILVEHNRQGHPGFLNGNISIDGWWYYFPAAIAMKSPVALLIAVALAALLWIRSPRTRGQRTLLILVPAVVFLGVSMTGRINIGVRHVLPAIPFLFVFAAMWLARGRVKFALAGLIVLSIVETAAVHPDYLAFFNRFAGGPRGGDARLLDSNLDWGQDLWRLKRWLDEHAQGRSVTLRPFGNPRLREWPAEGWKAAPEGSRPAGLFAVSKNYSRGVYDSVITLPDGRRFREPPVTWVRQREPVARIGYSIEIYDLDNP